MSRRASRGGGRFRRVSESRGELLGEEGDFVAFQKVEASFSERRSISSCFRNRGEPLGEAVDLVMFRKCRGEPLGEELDLVMLQKLEAGFSERGSISACFGNLDGLSVEMVDFGSVQKSRRGFRRGGNVSTVEASFSERARFGHVSGISVIVPAM
jgi:hypothetical protein